MSPLLAALALVAGAQATPGLARVDVLAATPGTWLSDEAPVALHRPGTAALRLAWQVQPVWRLPAERFELRTSLASQAIGLTDLPGRGRWHWSAGLQTRLLLPNGAYATAGLGLGPVHLELGASLLADARWADPDWRRWRVLPAAGIGLVRRPPDSHGTRR